MHTDKDHVWHMETLAKVCREDLQVLLPTPYRVVDVTDPASQAAGVEWWTKLTEEGGEGMAVKPFDVTVHGPMVTCVQREAKVRTEAGDMA